MDVYSALEQNLGLITFSGISLALAVYLVYYMVRPQRF